MPSAMAYPTPVASASAPADRPASHVPIAPAPAKPARLSTNPITAGMTRIVARVAAIAFVASRTASKLSSMRTVAFVPLSMAEARSVPPSVPIRISSLRLRASASLILSRDSFAPSNIGSEPTRVSSFTRAVISPILEENVLLAALMESSNLPSAFSTSSLRAVMLSLLNCCAVMVVPSASPLACGPSIFIVSAVTFRCGLRTDHVRTSRPA